jgi:hypothetical protein
MSLAIDIPAMSVSVWPITAPFLRSSACIAAEIFTLLFVSETIVLSSTKSLNFFQLLFGIFV